MISTSSGKMVSVAMAQARQRIIGARATVVDDDSVIVALSELVRGSWSNDAWHREAAFMGAYVSSNGNSGRRDLTMPARELLRHASNPNVSARISLHASMAAI